MAQEAPKRLRMWSFMKAPLEFQRLFPEGGTSEWVTHVPASERPALGSLLLQWRPVYPVRLRELADRSAVYFGAPSGALQLIATEGERIAVHLTSGQERRTAARVKIECPGRYETTEQGGFSHTINMSTSGVSFTTESLLGTDTEVSLRVTWPVRLEGGVPVELFAVGKLARAESTKAAMQMDSMRFAIEAGKHPLDLAGFES